MVKTSLDPEGTSVVQSFGEVLSRLNFRGDVPEIKDSEGNDQNFPAKTWTEGPLDPWENYFCVRSTPKAEVPSRAMNPRRRPVSAQTPSPRTQVLEHYDCI